jgi:hypothetical protein
MVKWLYKILFLFIICSFFISATELDLGESHNTFFDEYDTYAKADQISDDHTSIIQEYPNSFVLLSDSHNDKSIIRQEGTPSHLPGNYSNHYTPKLFLRNSVWRI